MPKIRLLAPWEDAEALLEDERRMLEAAAASEEDGSDEVTWEAVEKVFGTLSRISDPSEELILGYNAVEANLLTIQDLDAAARRLGLNKEELLTELHAFVDRSGWYKAPFRKAVKVAQHCCGRFPREVLGRIQKDEDELRPQLVSGNLVISDSWWVDSASHREYAEERLRELEPVHTVIRGWCGQEASEEFDQMLALREEVDRLRNLVQEPRGG